MPWYDAWRQTRWRFFGGLALMACSAVATVLVYPRVRVLLPTVPADGGGELGQRLREAAELASSYRGYVWSNAFRQNLSRLATLFAVLLGTGFLGRSQGALFTLSLPVSRHRLLAVRFALGLGELLALALVPALLVPLLSPAVGATYDTGSALAHGACLFVASAVFLSLALLFSTLFDDRSRPLLAALAVAVALALLDPLLRAPGWSLYAVMSGESFFRSGRLPWPGLVASAVASAALYYGALVKLVHRDF
jgi:hypothetical protein